MDIHFILPFSHGSHFTGSAEAGTPGDKAHGDGGG